MQALRRVVPRAVMALLLVAGSMSCAASPAWAQGQPLEQAPHRTYGSWHASRIGGGGYLQNVLFTSEPNVLYTWVDVGGMYRSDDTGATWRMLQGSLPATAGNRQVRAMSIDPRDANRLLVATGSHWEKRRDGVFLSLDGGRTFTSTLDAALFAGNAEARNAGQVLLRSPGNPKLVLAASMGDGVFRSLDGGRTWTNVGLPNVYFTALHFDVTNPNRVWACALPFRGFRLGEAGVALAGGLYRSDDAGQTWNKVTDESPSEIVQSPGDPAKLIGIFNRKLVASSTDGGATWANFHQGLPSSDKPGYAAPEAFTAITALSDTYLTGAGDGTMYRRGIQDAQWTAVKVTSRSKPAWTFLNTPESGAVWNHFGRAISSIVVDPRDTSHWLMTDWYALWQSRDAGRTWNLAIDGIESTVIHTLAQDPEDPAVVHMGMADNGYFRSTDGGASFTHITAGGITNNIKAISVSPASAKRVFAVGPREPGPWHANAVFVSLDRGANWMRAAGRGLPDLSQRRCNSVVVDPVDAKHAFITVSGNVAPNEGGVYETLDGGFSWRWVGQGLPERAIFREAIWHVGQQMAVSKDGSMVSYSHETGGVFARSNSSPWVQVLSDDIRPVDVAADPFVPGRYLLAAGNGLYESSDSGNHWQEIPLGQRVFRVTFDMGKSGRVGIGTRIGPMLSTNGGASFEWLDTALPARVDNNIAFAGDRMVIGTPGCGVFWIALSDLAKQPIAAKPESLQPSAANQAIAPEKNLLPPIRESKPGEPGWGMRWAGKGKPRVVFETEKVEGKGDVAVMSVVADEPSVASAGADLPQGCKRIRIIGEVNAVGAFEECQIALQSWADSGKTQNGWTTLIQARGAQQWTKFDRVVDLPDQYQIASVRVVVRGTGKVSIREVQAAAVE